jgi:iron(III) transport system ATP-binding protein
MTQLEFIDVYKRYSPSTPWVVSGVNIKINQGELVTLLGPSGCGKTTILRMIAGLEQSSQGQICIAGQDVTSMGPAERPVSMMFQSYALFPHLNVLDNVMYGLRMQRVPNSHAQDRALGVLEQVGLAEFAHRWPSELSGGQQQRVALARSLVIEPKILLFDEPLSNLDARLRREMRQEIRQLQQRLNLTVVYVTHDQGEAMAVSDRIVVLNHGQVEQQGSPQELYEHPANAFVARFMGEAMLIPGEVLPDQQGIRIGSWTWRGQVTHAPGAVSLAVRPEAWQLAPPGTGLRASVQHRAFMGAVFELSLRTELGDLWLQCPTHPSPPSVGAEIGLTLGPGVVILPRPLESAQNLT